MPEGRKKSTLKPTGPVTRSRKRFNSSLGETQNHGILNGSRVPALELNRRDLIGGLVRWILPKKTAAMIIIAKHTPGRGKKSSDPLSLTWKDGVYRRTRFYSEPVEVPVESHRGSLRSPGLLFDSVVIS